MSSETATSMGYAAQLNNVVLTGSVASTARGAMVNYLALRGVIVLGHTSDEQIRAEYLRVAERARASGHALELVVVRCQPVQVVDPATVGLTSYVAAA